jgi:cellulose synthase/poly-beta-1,6-N-acetylglucosamine synthase-like glycosyltransferase
MSRLSITIVAWNEEERLRACLESVAWADEIIVVDGESTDKTVALAREFTDRSGCAPGPALPPRRTSRWSKPPATGCCRSTRTSA